MSFLLCNFAYHPSKYISLHLLCFFFLSTDRPSSEAALMVSKSRYKEPERQPVSRNTIAALAPIVAQVISSSNFIIRRTQEISGKLYSECSAAEKAYYDKFVCVSEEEARNLCLHTVGQSNDLWEKARYGKVTGSICYELFTYSKNKKPQWAKKLERIYDNDFQGNEDTETGLMYENDARLCYERKYKDVNIVTPGIVFKPVLPLSLIHI